MAGAPRWLALLMRLNPLTYGIAALRGTLGATPVNVPLAITAALALLAFAADLVVTRDGRVE